MRVEWRYLNGSAAMGEQWCRGEVGYERKDRVLKKGSASGREEAYLALALGADQRGRWRGTERQKSAALKAALNSAINSCRSSFETAAKERKELSEKELRHVYGRCLPDEATAQTRS